MADPITPVVSAVEPDVKPSAITDNVNAHTPDPATPPVVDDIPDPPRPDTDGLAELRTIVERLATTVTTLSEAVLAKTPDESPTARPWTHRGGHLPHGDES